MLWAPTRQIIRGKSPFALDLIRDVSVIGAATSFTFAHYYGPVNMRDRRYSVAVISSGASGTNGVISSVVLNTNWPFSQVVQASNSASESAAIFIADTTHIQGHGNLVVTFNITTGGCRLGLFNLINPDLLTALTGFNTAQTIVHVNGVATLSLNIPPRGQALGALGIRNNQATTATWVGLTEVGTITDFGGNDYGSMAKGGAEGLPTTVTCTLNDTTPQAVQGVSASWGP